MSYSEAEKKESIQTMNTIIRDLNLDVAEIQPSHLSNKKINNKR
jgi:hypothetical protein